jgi:hypothetical protein
LSVCVSNLFVHSADATVDRSDALLQATFCFAGRLLELSGKAGTRVFELAHLLVELAHLSAVSLVNRDRAP